ncbi:MAG TPA: hypothetical protein VMT85_02665 [Thermoanaerobaculia bacterium]|nr:hypothetical protein [Thermoanaerobaculia bacterium]
MFSWSLDYVPEKQAATRAAVIAAARDWLASEHVELRRVGALLLLGHGETAADGDGVPWEAGRLLEVVLGAQRSEHRALDLEPWIAVAVQRALEDHAVERRGQGARLPEMPPPEAVGLPRPTVERLFARLVGVRPPGRSGAEPLEGRLDQTRFVLARSLGEAGRRALIERVRSLDPSASETFHAFRTALGQIVEWMTNLAPTVGVADPHP